VRSLLVLVSEVDAQNGETARRFPFYFKAKGVVWKTNQQFHSQPRPQILLVTGKSMMLISIGSKRS